MTPQPPAGAGTGDGPTVPEAELEPDELGTLDVTASTVANIGPGIDFYFGFGVIAVTAGVAAPLTILAAAVAVFLLAATVAEFDRAEPSSGSFITYVESGLGRGTGLATALLVMIGYTVAMAGVITMSGGFIAMTLAHYTAVDVPWGPITVVVTLGALYVMIRGIRLSTSAVGAAVVVQVVVMVAVCVVVLADHRGHLSSAPFSWSHLSGGLAGLSAGFPLALYMFIGWENGPALAEESRRPRQTIPRALYLSIGIATVLFVLFAYSTVTGFDDDVSSIGRSSVPFLTVADRYLGGAAVLAWLAGIASVLATLVAGTSSQARMLFDAGRTGLLPGWLGRVRADTRTPANALVAFTGIGLGIIGLWAIVHLVGVGSGSMNPVGLYAECSTMGTIVILFVYALTVVALPAFVWRRHRPHFSVVRHIGIPLLGLAALVVPFVELFSPGQPAPYDAFPFIALGIAALAGATGAIVGRRRPSVGTVPDRT
ncbi:MAG TPA: APC family permease [Acidimicrobiales bacterium]|nr:APC family permease [Acidimicrobiales bacterium]